MVLLVFLLLCSCLGCLREGVWTKYTPADVARWKAFQVVKTPGPHLLFPAQRLEAPRFARALSNPVEGVALRHDPAVTPARKLGARAA